ncbi:MAG: hypothetical protein PWP46_910 [Fusobacteriaceae bacterium]|nr:hypothetical protein [Fusobacteriales bacterium]MDN5304031.1 hypothetical protein [Fusobacteriaceae bacterium]
MKKLMSLMLGLMVLLGVAVMAKGNANRNIIVDTQKYSLTDTQKEALVYMYQEEQLARDVYIKLGEYWNARVFQNISRAEQQHMDAVKALLDKYDIKVEVNAQGVFQSEEFQNLYNELVKKGMENITEAYKVGRDIEILDIKDLDERLKDVTPDMKSVFENLRSGSEQHLKAFNRQL